MLRRITCEAESKIVGDHLDRGLRRGVGRYDDVSPGVFVVEFEDHTADLNGPASCIGPVNPLEDSGAVVFLEEARELLEPVPIGNCPHITLKMPAMP